jgi:membrane protease YdiL (CAAX protease family)
MSSLLQCLFVLIFSRVDGWTILASALGGLFLVFLPWGLVAILELAGIKIPDIPAQAVLPSNLHQLPLAIAGVVVIGPLSEELIFRGLLLDWLKQRMAVWPAALIISLFFAFLHNISFKNGIIGWIGFGVRFLLGVGASFFAIRYRSLQMGALASQVFCAAGHDDWRFSAKGSGGSEMLGANRTLAA